MKYTQRIKSGIRRIGFFGAAKYILNRSRIRLFSENPFVTYSITRLIVFLDRLKSPKFLFRLINIKRDQAVGARMLQLKTILTNNLNEGARIMEVGSWFGEGSTQIILENAPKYSTIFIVDSWKPYTSDLDRISRYSWLFNFYKTMDDLTFSAFRSISSIILNYEKLRPDLKIVLIRADSLDILSVLQENFFNLIYLDGSHYYERVSSDIRLAKLLINKEAGIICGDDLEKLPNESDLILCRQNLNRDFIQNSNYEYFHPGVMLAISEEFTQVKMASGFWWITTDDSNSFSKS
jgi:hypothetical protein